MTFEVCMEFLEFFSNSSGIPICVFRENRLMYAFHASMDLESYYGNVFRYMRKNGPFMWEDGLLICYLLETEEYFILFGPVKTSSGSSNDFQKFIYKMGIIDKDMITRVLDELFGKRPCTLQKFSSAVNACSLAICGEKAEWPAQDIPSETLGSSVVSTMEEPIWSQENMRLVEKMKYIISNGMTEELEKFISTESYSPYGHLAKDGLRHFKNSMMSHIYIVRTAASDGGLDEDLGLRLAESYSQRCELANSVEEMRQISIELRRDYCRRVHELRKIDDSDQIVYKAIRFIKAHKYEKMDARTIADAQSLSASYLSHHFKQTTGKSMTEFVQEEKIETAKYLLANTDHSLSQIASALSFSSQAYFQKVFKKIVTQTPLEYRKQNQYL